MNDDVKMKLAVMAIADGQTVTLPLRGASMRPLLQQGRDVVHLGPVQYPIKKGKIYLFEYQGRMILHRLVRIEPDGLTFEGDNNSHTEQTPPQAVKGQLLAVERHGRRLDCGRPAWRCLAALSRLAGCTKRGLKPLGRGSVRKRLLPFYLTALAVLMWAPLNGLGVPLNNFVLGIRADHLLHASVYLPGVFFMAAVCRFKPLPAWFATLLVALTTECVQYVLPYRGFDINDLIANAIGASIGLGLTLLVHRRHPQWDNL